MKPGVREAYAAHSGELYGFAVHSLGEAELAEEAVQETFLRAWRAGDRFDPEIGSLRTRLFAILRDVLIDLGRAPESLLAWQVEEAMRRVDERYARSSSRPTTGAGPTPRSRPSSAFRRKP